MSTTFCRCTIWLVWRSWRYISRTWIGERLGEPREVVRFEDRQAEVLMFDVLEDIERWRAEDRPVALATVIQTWGSAPRGVGAKMAMMSDARIAGSVSGGCVEAAVVEAGTEVLKSGKPRLLHFGVSDETAWEVGLACGGKIEVFVAVLNNEAHQRIKESLEEDRAIASITVVDGAANRSHDHARGRRDGRRFSWGCDR